MDLKGSKTEANLQFAFAGESQARNKYTYWSQQARNDASDQIAGIFNETANNEKEHARLWWKLLNGEDSHAGPDAEITPTLDNLLAAAAGEHHEWTEMYKGFAEVAKEEGFNNIAAQFLGVADIEKSHEERYKKLHKHLSEGTLFKKNEVVTWHCRNCGHLQVGDQAPKKCPVCGDDGHAFELFAQNY